MSLRILATADLHLGMRFGGYPPLLQAGLTEARFAALEKLVAQGNARECRLLIVAGDLFHGLSLPKREIQRAAAALNEFHGEAVAVLPGNHDYYTGGAGSLWKSFRESADGHVLLLSDPQAYELAPFNLQVILYPGPCTQKHSRENTLGWLAGLKAAESGRRREQGALAIGVAHGSLEGVSPDAQGEYYPMRRAELESYGLDLWVLGHTHRPPAAGGLSPDADDRLFLPGTPEPDGFDCERPGSALLLQIEGGRVRAERLDTGTYRFRREVLEVAGEEPEAGRRSPSEALARFFTPEYERTLLRLTLRGSLEAEALQRVRAEAERLKQVVAWLETDDTELRERITADKIEAEFARGSFSWLLLRRLLEAGEGEALEQAYELIREVRE
jgi:DNA repair exonuclease SbcCD nuclease subunit